MTTSPPAPPGPATRRPWTRLEAPQAALLAAALVAFDAVGTVVVVVVRGDPSCTTLECRLHGVSTVRPLVGVIVAFVVAVGPVLVMWWRRRGLRTTVVVQVVVGGVLIVWAAHALATAVGYREDPPAVPMLPSLRPCVEKTLAGFTCVTYPDVPPVTGP